MAFNNLHGHFGCNINGEHNKCRDCLETDCIMVDKIWFRTDSHCKDSNNKHDEIPKKIFISQPMNGKTDEEILSERNLAIEKCKSIFTNCEPIDSFFNDAPDGATPLWYLGESIKLLGEADVAFFCKDWKKYRGCVIEHECAVAYGKSILYA